MSFTLKLYGINGKTRIVSCDSFTLEREQNRTRISAHAENPPHDSLFIVSREEPQDDTIMHWDSAYITNAAGNTVESIRAMLPARDNFKNAPPPRCNCGGEGGTISDCPVHGTKASQYKGG